MNSGWRRLQQLESRLKAAQESKQHQDALFARLCVRLHFISRYEQARDHIPPGVERVPNDPELAWTDYVVWIAEASCPFMPDADPLTHERYLAAFELESPLYARSCLRQPA